MADENARTASSEEERLRRWRLVLGRDSEGDCMAQLQGDDLRMDRTLEALYDSDRKGGLGGSSPNVNRWLGDIRTYFPSSTVKVMQVDALERLNLTQMLLEPETLESLEPDVHLVATILQLSSVIPAQTRETARQVVRKVTRELEERLAVQTVQAILGSLNRSSLTRRPRPSDINWDRTIRANLGNYVPETRTIVPEKLIGNPRGRKQNAVLREIVLCVDQSGSMASSVVYSGILGSVMASIKAVKTHFVAFDTSVADLTKDLHDPVDLLFGTQLGGGTDINRALAYCQELITRPTDTILILITDLYEGGDHESMLRRLEETVQGGTQVICLLTLSDDGVPRYDHELAKRVASLGITAFGCTPDLFPDMMAAAIRNQDMSRWAASNDIATVRPKETNDADS